MIYLVHGDDTAKSRSLILAQQRKLGVEKRIEISLEDSSAAQITEMGNNPDLFGVFPFMVIDISSASKDATDSFSASLGKINPKTTVIIFSNKSVSEKQPACSGVRSLGGKIIENNKTPDSNIFRFVDAVFSKNRYLAYKEYEKLLKAGTEPVYLISMLEFGLRNCILLNTGAAAENKMSPFVRSKSLKFSEKFTPEGLKGLHSFIYDTEKKLKTGGVSGDLAIPMIMEKVLNS